MSRGSIGARIIALWVGQPGDGLHRAFDHAIYLTKIFLNYYFTLANVLVAALDETSLKEVSHRLWE